MQEAINRCLKRESFDIIQLAFPVMGYFSFESSAVKILDAANIEYDIHRRVAESSSSAVRRWWASYEYRKLYPQEIRICSEQDAITLTSERDRALLDKDVPAVPKFVIPNGVDTSYFNISDGSQEESAIVFTGAINYFPNADGIENFITHVFPLIQRQVPGVKLYVVGNAPPESVRRHASESIVVTGFVDDVRPYIARASVYVVPLRIGGGTRLKVLEALSMRCPIVSTSVGCEGIDVVDGESILVADEPQAFADATVRLLRDRQLRRSLVDRGYELVRSRYDWSVVGAQIESVYSQVVQARAGAKIKQ
jgi:glycosyltransferase involved in cell wall biosynthesis